MIDNGIGASSKEQRTINSEVNQDFINKLLAENIELLNSNFSK